MDPAEASGPRLTGAVENGINRVRDGAEYAEDSCRARKGTLATESVASRNTAVSMLRDLGLENISRKVRELAANAGQGLGIILPRAPLRPLADAGTLAPARSRGAFRALQARPQDVSNPSSTPRRLRSTPLDQPL